jgi:hypothetical protein
MRGEPFLARIENGLFKPKNTKLGADVAGRVEAIRYLETGRARGKVVIAVEQNN